MPSILVVRRGGLGDSLLLLPVLRCLQRQYPDHVLHYAGNRDHLGPLWQHGVVAAIQSSEDLELWALATQGERGERARALLQRHAMVVADQPLPPLAGVVVHSLDPKPSPGQGPIGRQLARRLGLEPRWPDDAMLAVRAQPLAGPWLLAPGSGSPAKCWPRAAWLALAAALLRGGCDLQVLVGPTEQERDDPRGWPWPVGVQFVLPSSSLALADALALVGGLVGNDSGTTHLAAMLGVPTVVLFGPSDAAVWAPPAPATVVLEAPGGQLAALGVAEVRAACARLHGSLRRTFCQ